MATQQVRNQPGTQRTGFQRKPKPQTNHLSHSSIAVKMRHDQGKVKKKKAFSWGLRSAAESSSAIIMAEALWQRGSVVEVAGSYILRRERRERPAISLRHLTHFLQQGHTCSKETRHPNPQNPFKHLLSLTTKHSNVRA